MSAEWVEVYKSFPNDGFVRAVKRVQNAGIPVRIVQGSPNTRWMYGALHVRDSVYVPPSHVDQARRILAECEKESDDRVAQHLKGAPAELAVGVALAAFVICAWSSVAGEMTVAIIAGIVCVLFMPAAWKRLSRNKPAKTRETKKRRWF